jgi:RNA polymerase sporulation-specific sigma factor
VNENALVREWLPFAFTITSEFFHPKIDREDLRQEALISVMEAGRSYDPTRGTSFKAFVAACIRNSLMDAVTTANREKRDHRKEAPAIVVTEDGGELSLIDLVPAANSDPHDLLAQHDEVRRIVRGVRSLSPLEHRAVLALVNDEHPHTGGIDKQLDNALLRARAKLRLAA